MFVSFAFFDVASPGCLRNIPLVGAKVHFNFRCSSHTSPYYISQVLLQSWAALAGCLPAPVRRNFSWQSSAALRASSSLRQLRENMVGWMDEWMSGWMDG